MHSFAGIGAGDAGLQRCYDLASRAASAQAWKKCKRLIIDEISMVDGEFFEVSDPISSPFHFNELLLMGFFCFFNRKSKRWHVIYEKMTNPLEAFN